MKIYNIFKCVFVSMLISFLMMFSSDLSAQIFQKYEGFVHCSKKKIKASLIRIEINGQINTILQIGKNRKMDTYIFSAVDSDKYGAIPLMKFAFDWDKKRMFDSNIKIDFGQDDKAIIFKTRQCGEIILTKNIEESKLIKEKYMSNSPFSSSKSIENKTYLIYKWLHENTDSRLNKPFSTKFLFIDSVFKEFYGKKIDELSEEEVSDFLEDLNFIKKNSSLNCLFYQWHGKNNYYSSTTLFNSLSSAIENRNNTHNIREWDQINERYIEYLKDNAVFEDVEDIPLSLSLLEQKRKLGKLHRIRDKYRYSKTHSYKLLLEKWSKELHSKAYDAIRNFEREKHAEINKSIPQKPILRLEYEIAKLDEYYNPVQLFLTYRIKPDTYTNKWLKVNFGIERSEKMNIGLDENTDVFDVMYGHFDKFGTKSNWPYESKTQRVSKKLVKDYVDILSYSQNACKRNQIGEVTVKTWNVLDWNNQPKPVSDSLFIDNELYDEFNKSAAFSFNPAPLDKNSYYKNIQAAGGFNGELLKIFRKGCMSKEIGHFRENLLRLIKNRKSLEAGEVVDLERNFKYQLKLDAYRKEKNSNDNYSKVVLSEFEEILERVKIDVKDLNRSVLNGEFLPRYSDLYLIWESMYTNHTDDEISILEFSRLCELKAIDYSTLKPIGKRGLERVYKANRSKNWVEKFGRLSDIEYMEIKFGSFEFAGSGKDLLILVLINRTSHYPIDALNRLYTVDGLDSYDDAVGLLK